MESRGGETGGASILDALREYERRGYDGQFRAVAPGSVQCLSCRGTFAPADVPLESARRVEGVSDPADESVVGALSCPGCGARGTAVFAYGPRAPPEDAEALRRLEDARPRGGGARGPPWLNEGP